MIFCTACGNSGTAADFSQTHTCSPEAIYRDLPENVLRNIIVDRDRTIQRYVSDNQWLRAQIDRLLTEKSRLSDEVTHLKNDLQATLEVVGQLAQQVETYVESDA